MPVVLKLGQKVLALLAIPVLFIAGFIASIGFFQNRLHDAEKWALHSAEVHRKLMGLARSIAEADSGIGGWFLSDDPRFDSLASRARLDARQTMRQLRTLVSDNPAQAIRMDQIAALVEQRLAILDRQAVRLREGRRDLAGEDFINGTRYGMTVEVQDLMRRFVEEERRLEHIRQDRLEMTRTHIRNALVTGGAVAAILTLSFAVVFARGMARRLNRLSENARRIAEGEPLLPILAASDEIGRLDGTLHRMAIRLADRARLAAFGLDVGTALTRRENLSDALEACATAMIQHLNASIASVWVLPKDTGFLELKGSAGFGATTADLLERVEVGKFRVGRIAAIQKPELVQLDRDPARDDDKNWARNRGMRSFAGYPLVVRSRTVGVLAMFAEHEMSEATIQMLASVSDQIALGIDRARANEELAASEERTRAIIGNMLNGLITTDTHAIIESVNPAAETIFGYSSAELLGQHLSILVPLPEGGDPRSFLREALNKALGRVTEWPARRKDGSVFSMELALFPFETATGRHFAGNLRDVSERNEVERMKKEFVSTVSHELRTPLTSIRGSLGLLAGGVLGELPEEAKEVVAVAERNVVRLVTLINDILDLERLDTGRLEMTFERVPVATILARSLEAVAAFAEHAGITLESVATSATLFGDPDRLVQVLVNLVSNAVKFSKRGSTVTISVAESQGVTEICVRDRGRGIPPAFRNAIFGRFRQVEASDARQKGGTGLGLAICKAIVEQHGGTIHVDSEEGVGSVFRVRIPLPRASSETGAFRAIGAAQPDVLLVEDDSALVDVLRRQLSAAGLAVRTASTGEAAIARIRKRMPELLVLDVALPGGDGFAVVAELRKDSAGRHLPLLVYTERDLNADERERLRLGPTRFLTKSRATDQEFLSCVFDMLATPQAKGG